jgi:hypothetical protein
MPFLSLVDLLSDLLAFIVSSFCYTCENKFPMTANELLSHYNCTENYYKHNAGLVYTDGVQALCSNFQCYWFLDVIASYQYKLKDEEFQAWKLIKQENDSALMTCDDGNGNILFQQRIPYTDFEMSGATVWIERNVILLPSEH